MPRRQRLAKRYRRSGSHRANNKVRTVLPATLFATVGLRSAHCACACAMAWRPLTAPKSSTYATDYATPVTAQARFPARTLRLLRYQRSSHKQTRNPLKQYTHPHSLLGIVILRCYDVYRERWLGALPRQAAPVRPAFPFRLRYVTLRCIAATFRPCVPCRYVPLRSATAIFL